MSRTRRELFSAWFGSIRGAAGGRSAASSRGVASLLRPPGARLPDENFLEACTSCGDCIEACPADALFAVDLGEIKGLPAIDPQRQPCLLCTDVPCIPACPEEALLPVPSANQIRLGIARVNPNTCVTFRGEICDRCFQACPYPHAALMLIGGKPIVGSGACTGCGLCEKVCPEHPPAINVIPERHLIPGLRVPKGDEAGNLAG